MEINIPSCARHDDTGNAMIYKILSSDDYNLYIDHVSENLKNSRTDDPELIDKIRHGLHIDPRVIIFAAIDNGKIVGSILTKKRVSSLEYYIVNYRTNGDAVFDFRNFIKLFSSVFDYYENIGYYRWVSSRPLDLFGKSFTGMGTMAPFDRYVTAIEYAPSVFSDTNLYCHSELLDGIPDTLQPTDFMLISGYCKQEHRKLYANLAQYFI